ncbi:ERAP1-like C-terminal domain,Peptidase M1, membrane alanine aminopeptidase, N-terminal [Cinara cedri]|uniref:ERAP1-like C-terminal domain,Peptidase M1, membrane alanine aminopeptidase, N-terminal n=1 Tax=Cinara cedri TaxID=506608 RepID=A0A5E4N3U1_9HEMI|nr:ERAP1-like C-terminal domain,Peptidase M1, membrane alanine aminopeptidase, N-terminal [Cinara cedri]
MAWWTDIWLNEGFATFMSIKVIEVIHPDWDFDTMFLTYKLHVVLDKDSQINSHPIVQEVSNPQEIDSIFDIISYDKGASILRMLEGMLGAEVFRIGIRAYLNRYQFGNAQTDDLWYEIQTAFENVADIKKVMHTWTQQEGYPLVTATLDGTKLTLEQHRFLIDSSATYCVDSSPFKYRWEIPLTYVTSENDTVHKLWLCSDHSSVTVELPEIQWIKINYRQRGFYIVNYSKSNWCALSNLLQTNINAISAADRANLLYDAFSLAEAQYLTYDIPLEMTKYLVGECHFVPWTVANTRFFKLWYKLNGRCEYPQYEKYLRHLLGGIEDDVWNVPDVQTFSQSRYRLAVIKLGGLCGEPTYATKIHEMFKNFLYENIAINPDIEEDIYNYGIAYGDVNDWNKVWHLYLKEQDPDKKLLFLVALSYSRDTSLLIQYGKTGSYVLPQNFINLLGAMSENPLANSIAWDFIRCEWQFLLHYLSPSNIGLGYITISICGKFNTQQRLDEMKAFFKNYPDAGAAKSERETALETVVQNIDWLKRNEAFIIDWLKNNNH